MEVVRSVNGVPIRLTDERWAHILENHDALADYREDILRTVSAPDRVIRGYGGALIAQRKLGKQRFLLVIYKEFSRRDGFVVTAVFSLTPKEGHVVWRRL